MSPVWGRRVLFLLALVVVPFPYSVVEGGWVPGVWLAGVAGLVAASALGQGGSISAIIARWYVVQALVVVGVAYLGAWVVAAGLRRVVAPARLGMVVGLLAIAGLGVAVWVPIFSATAVRDGRPTTLLGMFASW